MTKQELEQKSARELLESADNRLKELTGRSAPRPFGVNWEKVRERRTRRVTKSSGTYQV